MTPLDIAGRRLHNQHIAAPAVGNPADVMGRLVAVQAQDFAGAKWALGLRLQGATDAVIEQAFNAGAILRTHLLRPTWHFVTPHDIRWLLALTAPRVLAINGTMYRKLELNDAILAASNAALANALQGGHHLTRDELRAVLQAAGIATAGEARMSYHLMQAELDGVICSGPRRGKQFTYALLEERVPPVAPLSRDEALAELARRYFLSRGPATVQDLAKWSGLTVADARMGLEAVAHQLHHEIVDGQSYWHPPTAPGAATHSPTAYLLSIYDEYVSGYKDRSAIVSASRGAKLVALGNDLQYIVVVDGQIVGTWKRTLRKDAVIIKTHLFTELTAAEHHAVAAAAHRYGKFLDLPAVLA